MYEAKDPLEPEDRSALQALIDAFGQGVQKAEAKMAMTVALHRVVARIAKRLRERDQAVRLLANEKPQEARLLAVVRDREATIAKLREDLSRSEFVAWHAIVERNAMQERLIAALAGAERS